MERYNPKIDRGWIDANKIIEAAGVEEDLYPSPYKVQDMKSGEIINTCPPQCLDCKYKNTK